MSQRRLTTSSPMVAVLFNEVRHVRLLQHHATPCNSLPPDGCPSKQGIARQGRHFHCWETSIPRKQHGGGKNVERTGCNPAACLGPRYLTVTCLAECTPKLPNWFHELLHELFFHVVSMRCVSLYCGKGWKGDQNEKVRTSRKMFHVSGDKTALSPPGTGRELRPPERAQGEEGLASEQGNLRKRLCRGTTEAHLYNMLFSLEQHRLRL